MMREVMERRPLLWAVLLVAADVVALVILGLLVGTRSVDPAVGLPPFLAILAGGRFPAAVRLMGERRRRENKRDTDPPPPGGAVVTGAVMALAFGVIEGLYHLRRGAS